MVVLTALLAAAAPTAIYSLLIWWLDRYEKEPLSLMAIAFLWGACPAVALALLLEFGAALPFEHTSIGPVTSSVVLSPLIEEPVKALALLGLFRWARHEFDGLLDGIVYGSLIGFGFSMSENALYFLHYQNISALLLLRSILFGLNHAFFTSMVGLAIGAVRYERGRLRKGGALAGGLALAMLFHAVHNLLVGGYATAGLLLSWLVQSSGVLAVLALAVLSWRHERSWLRDELRDEVCSGLLTQQEYLEITSSAGRTRQQIDALLGHGWRRFCQLRQLHQLLTKLAFRKSQLRLANHALGAEEPERLRRAIIGLRAQLGEAERS